MILKQVRENLKVIHKEWGFFGGISMEAIYYDKRTMKVQLTDWARNHLAFMHFPKDKAAGVRWPY